MDRAPATPSYRCSLQNFSYNFEDAWFCSDKYNVLKKTSTSITLPVSTLVTVTKPFFEEKPRFCQLPSTATASEMWLYFENFVGGGGRFIIPQNILADSAPLPMHRIAYTSPDESRFSLSSDCRRQLIWRESGTAYRPENIQEKDRYPTCSIMVWAGIMINGCTRLHVVANGTMTGQRYIDEVLLPHVRFFRRAVGDKFVFMDDNETCHRTLAVQDCLDSEGIQRLVRPARSPDLKPIENVWGCFGEASCWSKLSSDKQEHPHPCTHRGMG
ncbi:transposable element Tcb2 transposase [Trichonephila clavipes]|nr:transposable element Tcb2 transposase [Trichonephila clavipes]